MLKAIIPECYIDTNLIDVLLQNAEKKGVNHGKGNSSVATKMKNIFPDEFAVGIIDKDEKDIDYLKDEFEIVNDKIATYAILFKHKTRHHYIIQLCPVSETWICNVCKEVKIDLTGSDYKLPNNPIELGYKTKKVSSKYDPTFRLLFKTIVKKSEESNFEPVVKLKGWLRLLVDDNYKVDLSELKK